MDTTDIVKLHMANDYGLYTLQREYLLEWVGCERETQVRAMQDWAEEIVMNAVEHGKGPFFSDLTSYGTRHIDYTAVAEYLLEANEDLL